MIIKTILFVSVLAFYAFPANIHLTLDNNVNLRGEVNDESVNKWQTELSELVNKRGSRNYPIYLSIDSGGGSIDAGMAFIEYAKTIPNLHTITLFGASMASGIQQALPGRRYVLGSSTTMFHRAAGGFQGQFNDGEVESRLNAAKQMVSILEQQNAHRLQMSIVDYKAAVKDELWIVGGTNNVSKHAADEMVTATCEHSLITASSLESFQVFIFSITMRFSKCPLFRSGSVIKGEDSYKNHKKEFQKKLTGVYYMQAQ